MTPADLAQVIAAQLPALSVELAWDNISIPTIVIKPRDATGLVVMIRFYGPAIEWTGYGNSGNCAAWEGQVADDESERWLIDATREWFADNPIPSNSRE